MVGKFSKGGSPFVLQNLGLNLTLFLLLMKGEEKGEEKRGRKRTTKRIGLLKCPKPYCRKRGKKEGNLKAPFSINSKL